ncbi:MAG: PilZ domain-containing protein [Gammaproteobacteria bacterium]
MADKESHRSKRIRAKCGIQLISGHVLNGTTRSISIDGAFIECQPLSISNKTPPKNGDSALLTVYLSNLSDPVPIRTRCRINQVQADGISVSAQFAYLSKAELALFENFLKTAG